MGRPLQHVFYTMLAAVVWMALLTVALLAYPRRPRTAGTLLTLMGGWIFLLRYMNWDGGRVASGFWTASWMGGFWLVLGVGWIVRFSNAERRAAHIGYWTARRVRLIDTIEDEAQGDHEHHDR